MDKLYELKAFIAVAEAGGFSAAARQVGMPQPSISKAIAGLEKRLGVTLLSRSTRKVAVTDQGRRYYEQIKPLLEAMEQAEAEATGSIETISGLVRISAPATFGRLHILPLIPALLSRYPDLRIDLVLSDLRRDMLDDGIDLAIRIGSVDEQTAVARRIASTALVCVGSRQYFERYGKPTTPANLVDHNCLIYGEERGPVDWLFKGPTGMHAITVSGNLSSNSAEAIRAGVLAGLGIGLLTKVSLTDELADPDILTVLDEFVAVVRDVSLIWPNRRFIPARVRQTTEFFATALAQRLT